MKRHVYKQAIALALGALTLALLAGCGSGGEDALSTKDFSHQANQVCLKANKRAAAEFERSYELPEIKHPKSEGENIRGEVTDFVPILIKEAEAQLRGVGGLGAPSEDEAKVASILGAYKAWLKVAEAVPLRIVIGNDMFNNARELAGKAGLAKCAQTPFELITL